MSAQNPSDAETFQIFIIIIASECLKIHSTLLFLARITFHTVSNNIIRVCPKTVNITNGAFPLYSIIFPEKTSSIPVSKWFVHQKKTYCWPYLSFFRQILTVRKNHTLRICIRMHMTEQNHPEQMKFPGVPIKG